ncbi:MAG: cation:proton antiporter [Thermodesulfobacteriota bacterium]
MIAVKLLSDKGEIHTIAGRMTLGVLLVQDVLIIIFLSLQTNIANPSTLMTLLWFSKGMALVSTAVLAARYILPPLYRSVANLPEIILISTVSWCFLVSALAIKAGFSIAVGALIAGISLSNFPYNLDMIAKIRGLRDFVSLVAIVLVITSTASTYLTLNNHKICTATLRALRKIGVKEGGVTQEDAGAQRHSSIVLLGCFPRQAP